MKKRKVTPQISEAIIALRTKIENKQNLGRDAFDKRGFHKDQRVIEKPTML